MAQKVRMAGHGNIDKWVAIAILKDDRGWRQTRCGAGDILYHVAGGELTVTLIKTWESKNWDGRLSGNDRADAIWLAECSDIIWQ